MSAEVVAADLEVREQTGKNCVVWSNLLGAIVCNVKYQTRRVCVCLFHLQGSGYQAGL